MSMTASQWQDRGDSAAREDLRAGHVGEWDRDAVLTHLGILHDEDTDAVAYGLAGEELATAQREALADYARRMERGGAAPSHGDLDAWRRLGHAHAAGLDASTVDPHEGGADILGALTALGLDGAPDATRRAAWEGILARLFPQD